MGCGSGSRSQKTLEDGTVLTSDIISCNETNCVTDSATVTNLKSLDESSAKTILDALAGLDEADLQKFVNVIAELFPRPSVVSAPDSESDEYLPDEVVGSRERILGEPDQWLDIGDMKVPAYE